MSAATEEKAETPTEEASVTDDTAGSHADPPEKPPEEKVKVKGVVNWFNVAKGIRCVQLAFSRFSHVGRSPPCGRPQEGGVDSMRALPPHNVSIASGFFPIVAAARGPRLGSKRGPPSPPTAKPRSLFVHLLLCGTAFARARVSALGRRGF